MKKLSRLLTAALLSLDLSFGVIAACAFPVILIDIIFVVWRTNPLFTVLQESLDKLNSIIVLSTCAYEFNNARYIVIAVPIIIH